MMTRILAAHSSPVLGYIFRSNSTRGCTLIDLLPGGPRPAILECSSQGNIDHVHECRQVLDHARLQAFLMHDFPLLLQVHLCHQIAAATTL